jgi:hypothetical protein
MKITFSFFRSCSSRHCNSARGRPDEVKKIVCRTGHVGRLDSSASSRKTEFSVEQAWCEGGLGQTARRYYESRFRRCDALCSIGKIARPGLKS